MTAANSFTGFIDTNSTFVTVASVTVGVSGSNFTGFTTDKTYTIQVQNTAELKVSDAEFTLKNQFMQFKQGADDLYIKTTTLPCKLTILEEDA